MSADNAAVNSSELVNKNKRTPARLKKSPRLLLHRSDPELLAALTKDHGDDYGPAPGPRNAE